MSASQFASFAAYTPPPDEFGEPAPLPSSNGPRPSSAWFHAHPPEASYQSGAVPAYHNNPIVPSVNNDQAPEVGWETRYGWRVDLLAFFAYFLGPFSALALLIIETQNDYVRFHAYQSALMTTPLLFIRIILSLLRFPSWMSSVLTFLIIFIQIVMGLYAYHDASQSRLFPFHMPFVGEIAEKWLADE